MNTPKQGPGAVHRAVLPAVMLSLATVVSAVASLNTAVPSIARDTRAASPSCRGSSTPTRWSSRRCCCSAARSATATGGAARSPPGSSCSARARPRRRWRATRTG
ncbi:hypothetical protein ACFQY7_30220 [Actinomadura luteofluorescens]|uniref:hypothetical protein n=1 Tax=Actinomadura luteofluorescens TaxID=46163 RepID=UPI00363514B3